MVFQKRKIICQLETPQEIVHNIQKNEHRQSDRVVIKAILLILLNLFIMAGLFATGVGLLVALFSTVIIAITSPLFVIIDFLVGNGERLTSFFTFTFGSRITLLSILYKNI